MSDADLMGFVYLAIAVWWIAASFAVMSAAYKRGLQGGRWLMAGLFFGPIFAILLLMAQPAQRREADSHGYGWSLPKEPTA